MVRASKRRVALGIQAAKLRLQYLRRRIAENKI